MAPLPFVEQRAAWVNEKRKGRWCKLYVILKASVLCGFVSPDEVSPIWVVDVEGADVRAVKADEARRPHVFTVQTKRGTDSVMELLTLSADSSEEADTWLSLLLCAAVPRTWPGGVDSQDRPRPLHYSWAVRHSLIASEPEVFEPLPKIKDVPVYARRALVLKKLRQCSVVFANTLSEGNKPLTPSVSLKRQVLIELCDTYETVPTMFHDHRIFQDCVAMIQINLFRPLPVPPPPTTEEEIPFLDPQWAHLSLVFDFLGLLLQSQHSAPLAVRKKYLTDYFALQLVQLFASHDAKERLRVKQLSHALYSHMTVLRPVVRRGVVAACQDIVHEHLEHPGATDMLELLASIIEGFVSPLKQEHVVMFSRVLLPLHKPDLMNVYHPQLLRCIESYLAKEPQLLHLVLQHLNRYWPFRSPPKQLLFLDEVSTFLSHMAPTDIVAAANDITRLVEKAVINDHQRVLEKGLSVITEAPVLAHLVRDASKDSVPLQSLVYSVLRSSRLHWNDEMRALCTRCLAMLCDANPVVPMIATYLMSVDPDLAPYLEELMHDVEDDESSELDHDTAAS